METLNKEIKNIEYHFKGWSETLLEYVDAFLNCQKPVSEEDGITITMNLVQVFDEVLQFAIDQGKFKSQWHKTMFMPYVNGIVISKQSARTASKFELGMDAKGFYFQISPAHIRNLKYMDDSFWRQFLQLSEHGEFDFLIHESIRTYPVNREGNNLQVGKSKVFSLLRNYLLFELFGDDTPPFGSICIRWTAECYWDELLVQLTQVLKVCYKLDYMLWKLSYQKSMAKKT